MIVTIHGTGIELTPAIKDYVAEKITGLTKFFNHITKAEIDVGMRTHHHLKGPIHYAEVNLHLPGRVVRVVKEEENLYKAIDKVKDHLKVELRKTKGKLRARDRQVLRARKGYSEFE